MDLTINKIAAGVVGFAMVAGLALAFTATKAHAVTLTELVELFIALEVIPADKAEEARSVLAGQETTTPTTPLATAMSCSFTRNLKTGDTGQDVMDLQKLLNAKGFTVSVAGAGAPGQETQYYGPATAAAVSKMQVAFASEILTPLGLTNGTGFFGASTRAKANALCTAETPAVPGDDEDGDEDDDTPSMSNSEASLEKYDALSDPSDEELEEGDEEAPVFGFEFDVEDGDAKVTRVDVNFKALTPTKENNPWKSIEAVQLWNGDEMIDEMDTDSKADWSNKGSDVYQIRFSGLSEVLEEGDTAEMYVSVTVANIDDSDLEQEWEVWVPENGLRARDGAGIDQYTGSNAEKESFTIEVAGGETEMKLTTDSSNPKSSIIKVDTSKVTKDINVLVFGIEAKDGEVTLNKLVVRATTSTTTLATVLSDVNLELDGARLGDMEWDDDCDGTSESGETGAVQGGCMIFDLEADDDELTVDEDDKITGKIFVDLQKLTSSTYVNGDTIEFDIDTTTRGLWDVSDKADNAADTAGSANGEAHALQSEGIFAEIVSVDSTTKSLNDNEEVAEFTIKFDVTSFENTYYVPSAVADAVTFAIENSAGVALADITGATTSVKSLSSTATKDGSSYRVDEGDTETFTLKVTLNTDALTGSFRLQLLTVDFGNDPSTPTNEVAHNVSPAEDFETDYESINKSAAN